MTSQSKNGSVSVGTFVNFVLFIINLPNRKAHTKGKACPRCPPTKTNIHKPTTAPNNTQQIQTMRLVAT